MQKISLLTLLSFLCLAFSIKAQDSTAVADEGKLTFSGYIDQYYLHSFNNPGSGNLMGNAGATLADGTTPAVIGGFPAGRAFDRLTDQFALGLVQLKTMYSNKKSDMVLDLTFGPNAELGNFGNQLGGAGSFAPANGFQAGLYGSGIAIKQAYWTYKATSKLSFTAGQFGTHIGYEVIDAPVNYHYSLSNLFNNGPFYHVGLKANYAFTDNVGLMIGIVNNWDAMSDWKTQKSFIAQFFLKPTDGFNIYLNYIGGHNDDPFKVRGRVSNALGYVPAWGTDYNRHLFDITTGYQITDKFYLGLNAAYGFYSSGDQGFKDYAKSATASMTGDSSNTLSWGGIAGYVNYALTDYIGIGVRYEHFEDKFGVRYLGTVNNSLTITVPITLASGHLILKPEFRMDTAPGTFGQNASGATNYYYEKGTSSSTKTQTTLGIAAIYKY